MISPIHFFSRITFILCFDGRGWYRRALFLPAAGIALLILESHDGRIEVDSEPGHGSTFTMVGPATGPRDESDA